ncbi:MAG: GNAT family N-acetyltransferase [Candidatus Acidiferrales bacterium]
MSERFEISPAGDGEREWAARLMAGTDPWIRLGRDLERCRAACNNREDLLYLAHRGTEGKGEACGLLLMRRRGVAGAPYIVSLAVREDLRGLGVGGRMLQFAEDFFRGESRHIFMCVSSFNRRARELYERVGYRVVGEFPDYIIEGESEFLLWKRLRS